MFSMVLFSYSFIYIVDVNFIIFVSPLLLIMVLEPHRLNEPTGKIVWLTVDFPPPLFVLD